MSKHEHGRSHSGHHHEHGDGRDRFANPADLDAYLAKLEAEDRADWQKPDEVVRALGLGAGRTVAEVGVGTGYFALRLAREVGDRGLVYAVDVEPRLLEVLRDRLEKSGLRNVLPVLALADDPLLPPACCDVVLVVDAFHHIAGPVAYLRRLARALAPGGRIVNVDFHARETPVGPPVEHRLGRETFLAHAKDAGLAVVTELTFLPHQYFLVLRPA